MARLVTRAEARDLDLPGRKSVEIVSAEKGARAVTLRLVEIPVPSPGEKPREPHRHAEFEECIYVLSGKGCTETESGNHALDAGDAILISPGELHVTRNIGTEALLLLCFFPSAVVDR